MIHLGNLNGQKASEKNNKAKRGVNTHESILQRSLLASMKSYDQFIDFLREPANAEIRGNPILIAELLVGQGKRKDNKDSFYTVMRVKPKDDKTLKEHEDFLRAMKKEGNIDEYISTIIDPLAELLVTENPEHIEEDLLKYYTHDILSHVFSSEFADKYDELIEERS